MALTLKWPVPLPPRITSGYGFRFGKLLEGEHNAIDFGANAGVPVYAAADGEVERSYMSESTKTVKGYGNRIVLVHSDGYRTTYNHLAERFVKEGDIVIAGEQIGTVGNTGYSFGPHLHFELTLDGRYENPMALFESEAYENGEMETEGALIVATVTIAVVIITILLAVTR